MRKRILCMLVAVSMILTMTAGIVSAEASHALTINTSMNAEGTEVTAVVTLSKTEGIAQATLAVEFDKEHLTPKSVDSSSFISGMFSSNWDPSVRETLDYISYVLTGTSNATGTEPVDIMTIVFDVKDGDWKETSLTWRKSQLIKRSTPNVELEVDATGATVTRPEAPDFTFEADEVEYDGQAHSLVATCDDPDVSFAYEGNEKTDVGEYTVTAKATKAGCAPRVKTATLKITPAALEVNGFTVADKDYDATTNATIESVGTLVGVIGQDEVSIDTALSTVAFADADAEEDKAVDVALVLTGAKAGNYTIANPADVTATINPLTINVTATNTGKTTGTQDPAVLEYTFAPQLLDDGAAFTGALEREAGEVEGNYEIRQGTLTILPEGNYTINYTAGTFAIVDKTAQEIAVAPVDNITYGDADTITLDVTADATSGLTNFSYETSDDTVATVEGGVVTIVGAGTVTITVTEPGDDDYAEDEATVTFTVAPKELTVDVAVSDKVYDGTTTALVTLNDLIGVVGSDDVEVANMPATATFIDANAGADKAVSLGVALTLAGLDVANYTVVTPADLTATIEKAELTATVTATSESIVYGSALPEFAVSYTGFVNSETASVITTDATIDDSALEGDVTVGTYTVEAYGAEADNYTFSYVPVTIEVTPKAITITTLNVVDKAIDGTAEAEILTNSLVSEGIVSGDDVAIDLTGATAVFADAERGQDKAVTISGIALTGADAANYTIAATFATTGDIVGAADVVAGLGAFSLAQDAQSVTLPEVDSDFEIKIKTTDNADVIGVDGKVAPVAANTTVNVVFTITNKNFPEDTADSAPIAVTVLQSTSVTVTLNAAENGTAAGAGSYLKNQTITLTATPDSGYSFSGWYSGETKVSGNANYSFKITENVTFTPVFVVTPPSNNRRPSTSINVSVGEKEDKPVTPVEPTEPGTTTNPIVPSKKNIVLTIGKTDMYVYGEKLVMDVLPKINSDGRTLLPVRYVAEALGAKVEWNEADRTVLITLGNASIKLTIDSNIAVINGKQVVLDSHAIIESDRTLVPIRHIAEALGAEVLWNAQEQNIEITLK